jgi:hypothetical protein
MNIAAYNHYQVGGYFCMIGEINSILYCLKMVRLGKSGQLMTIKI